MITVIYINSGSVIEMWTKSAAAYESFGDNSCKKQFGLFSHFLKQTH